MENSPFGVLPPELRINIYELVLCQPGPIDLEPAYDTAGNQTTRAAGLTQTHLLALLKTCKQVSIEASKLFYSGNAFKLTNWATNSDYTQCLDPFLSHIGEENAAAIRHVQVHLGIAIPHSHDFNRMCRAMTNIQHRRGALPLCAFKLHFYVFGGRTEGQVDMMLDLRDKARLEASREACMARIKEVLERVLKEQLERIVRDPRLRLYRRNRPVDLHAYSEGLQMVCARFTGPE